MKIRLLAASFFLAVILVITQGACSPMEPAPTPEAVFSNSADDIEIDEPDLLQAEATSKPVPNPTLDPAKDGVLSAQTNLQADGNRIVYGSGNIPSLEPIDISLEGMPAWITALAFDEGLLWAVVLEDGRTQAFIVQNGQIEPYTITPEKIPAGMPPLLQLKSGKASMVVPEGSPSRLTHAVFINENGDTAFIDTSGNLVTQQDGNTFSLEVNAQPDARILVDEIGRLLLHTDPTDEYAHGIMADKIEAGSLTLVATQPEPEIIRKIPVKEGYVLEGIAPIWADLNEDGEREIIVTRSNADSGAQIIVLDEMGSLLASGPAIGRGGRWRHQLSAGPFGPNGEMELVDVLTPHIGGPTEFYQWQDDELVVAASADGYTSHVIGSRNLDMAAAGRFDDSGDLTILLPNRARMELGGIQHKADGARVAWTLPLTGKLVTNIAAAPLADSRLAVGVGQDNRTLRIWQPQ